MINFKHFKLKNFLELDLRWKLKRIGKHLGINIYPSFFKWQGLVGIYNKFILNMVFRSLASERKKKIFSEIQRITQNKVYKKNFLVSPPSSGSNYLRGVLSSYCEIYYKIGNGIPKFNSLTNKWIYSFSPIKQDTLFHQLNLQIVKEKFRDKFISDDEFHKRMIIFSRYPFIQSDLFKFEFEKKIILIREPFDWITSRYTQFEKNNFYEEGKINKKLIEDELGRLNNFIIFWKNKLKDENNFIILKFEEIVKEPNNYIKKVLSFFDYDDKSQEIIDRSIEINSKEFALKNLGVTFTGTRFKDPDIKKKNSEKIKIFTEEIMKNLDIKKNYLDLINLKSF
tara:strand:+ start:291 stop:1307 length:1017 start_codon:yes stop_codon:yes gene_type:complete